MRRTSGQLPPGRHGLSRETVGSHQTERILDAVVEVSAEVGYQGCAVEAILRRAGVGRRTFYELFDDRDDAFLAAVDRFDFPDLPADVIAAVLAPVVGKHFAAAIVADRPAGVADLEVAA